MKRLGEWQKRLHNDLGQLESMQIIKDMIISAEISISDLSDLKFSFFLKMWLGGREIQNFFRASSPS